MRSAAVALALAGLMVGGCAGAPAARRGAGASTETTTGGRDGAPTGSATGGMDGAPGGSGSFRALTAAEIQLDLAPAEGVLDLWLRGDRSPSAASKLAATLPIRTFQSFLARSFRCTTTRAELERALANPDSGVCGFGLDPVFRRRVDAEALLREIRSREPALQERIARRAAAYLPPADSWDPVRVWFAFASQLTFDAVTLGAESTEDSLPAVLINVTDVLLYAPTLRERADDLESVLAHEAFHAALRQVIRRSPGWQKFWARDRTPFTHIAQTMLNEGVAHYVDWLGRADSDSLFTDRPGGRETHAFSELTLACRRLRERYGPGWERSEVLQMAATGPLWSKYGAVSGMFAAFRIERAFGRDALIRAVAEGPLEFLRLYKESAALRPELKALPSELTAMF